MESTLAVKRLSALAQDARLAVFRLLVQAGPAGIAAGDIARALSITPNTLSAQLTVLANAGLVAGRREGRSIIYAADYDAMSALLAYLMRDCCQGRPEICASLPSWGGTDGAAVRAGPVETSAKSLVAADCLAPLNVLFLCTGNSARSIMAEAILGRLGAGRFNALSAGSFPKGEVNPHAIALLESRDYPTDGLRSKPWDEFAATGAPRLDCVITVCDNAAGEACPIWPGQPITAHWDVPDPAAATGGEAEVADAFARAFAMIEARIRLFADLPAPSLDRASLRRRLDAIAASTA